MRLTYLALRSAFKALRRNVFRSLLTCLGIVVGISAVIAIMEIGQGASLAMQRNIAQLGANLLFIAPGTAQPGGISSGSGTALTLTAEDCEAVREECTAISDTAPGVGSRLQLVYGHKNWQPLDVQGTSPSRLQLQNWSIAEGEPFTYHDVENASLVCVIGQTLARELFEGESPVGKPIRIRNANVKVVGVLQAKGASLVGQDQDDVLMMPWTTLKYRLSNQMLVNLSASASAAAANPLNQVNTLKNLYPGGSTTLYPAPSTLQQADQPLPVRFRNIDYICAGVVSTDQIPLAIRQITELLRERHHIPADRPDDFDIHDVTAITDTFSKTTRLVTLLLACVASISLVVGGVGIMNIMLVSVTERTREIGLRMAVGARPRDIRRQFLLEAAVLCLLGGVIGILVGHGAALGVKAVAHWPIEASVPAVVTAVVVSIGVGITFGFYPALKASRLQPIEAIRHE